MHTDRDDDFTAVMGSVQQLAAQWPRLARWLHLKNAAIELIERNNPRDAQGGLHDTITEWLKRNYNFEHFGAPSWRVLVCAVKELDNALAHKIAGNHRGSYGCACVHVCLYNYYVFAYMGVCSLLPRSYAVEETIKSLHMQSLGFSSQ